MAIANPHTVDKLSHNIDAPYWARLKAGEPDALGYLYDRYVDALFAIALRLTKNRDMAQDAIQEVFVDLWHYRGVIGSVDHSLAYLQKVLKNKLFKQLQSLLRNADLPDGDVFLSPDSNSEEALISVDEETELSYRLTRAISYLSQRQRQIVTLHFYEGLSYEQIAEKLSMNYQSVNNLAYRTMLRLRDHMMLLVLLSLAAIC